MITFPYIVKILSRISSQKQSCRINTLRNDTLNGITFMMTKKKTIYGDSLADLVNELLGHVLHNLPFCYDFSHHHQLDYINSASV